MTEKSGLNELRTPFPKSAVGLLPKPYKKDSPQGNCSECGKYHGLPALHLDYVGHAVVTNRLLDVDPEWSWEPMGLDEHGLPALDKAGNLWIRLTILGVTRIGVGDGPSAKIAIGDALRNAAMRFGVALDLWSKEELESSHEPERSLPDIDDLLARALADDATVEGLRALHGEAKAAGMLDRSVVDVDGVLTDLGSLITARGKALRGAAA